MTPAPLIVDKREMIDTEDRWLGEQFILKSGPKACLAEPVLDFIACPWLYPHPRRLMVVPPPSLSYWDSDNG